MPEVQVGETLSFHLSKYLYLIIEILYNTFTVSIEIGCQNQILRTSFFYKDDLCLIFQWNLQNHRNLGYHYCYMKQMDENE